MAKAINHPLYSAKKLSCDAPIPTVANIPAMIGIPQQLTTPKKAKTDATTPVMPDQIVFFLVHSFYYCLLYIYDIKRYNKGLFVMNCRLYQRPIRYRLMYWSRRLYPYTLRIRIRLQGRTVPLSQRLHQA